MPPTTPGKDGGHGFLGHQPLSVLTRTTLPSARASRAWDGGPHQPHATLGRNGGHGLSSHREPPAPTRIPLPPVLSPMAWCGGPRAPRTTPGKAGGPGFWGQRGPPVLTRIPPLPVQIAMSPTLPARPLSATCCGSHVWRPAVPCHHCGLWGKAWEFWGARREPSQEHPTRRGGGQGGMGPQQAALRFHLLPHLIRRRSPAEILPA